MLFYYPIIAYVKRMSCAVVWSPLINAYSFIAYHIALLVIEGFAIRLWISPCYTEDGQEFD